jgi:hypothetical protein
MSGWILAWILAAVVVIGAAVVFCECAVCRRERTGVDRH